FQRVFTGTRGEGGDYRPGSNVLRGVHYGGYRRGIAHLAGYGRMTVFARWPDFTGRYGINRQNLGHADSALTARGDGVTGSPGFGPSDPAQRTRPPGDGAPDDRTATVTGRIDIADRARGRARSTPPDGGGITRSTS